MGDSKAHKTLLVIRIYPENMPENIHPNKTMQ